MPRVIEACIIFRGETQGTFHFLFNYMLIALYFILVCLKTKQYYKI